MRVQRPQRSHARSLLVSLFGMGLAAVLAGAGCGLVAKKGPEVGGESHFLHWCSGSCDEEGLECISGLCTKPCVVAEPNACTAFTGASCTDRSIEPGAVAVCDVSCVGDKDCAALGSDYSCQDSFCRGPESTRVGSSASASDLDCSACLESPTLSWLWLGGSFSPRHASIIKPCNTYAHEFVPLGADDPLGSPQCEAVVARCPARDLVALNATLHDPEIQAALAARTLFGADHRAGDGIVRQITVGDARFLVGDPCFGASGCIDIPPAVNTLITQLHAIDTLELNKEPCASVFPEGWDFANP